MKAVIPESGFWGQDELTFYPTGPQSPSSGGHLDRQRESCSVLAQAGTRHRGYCYDQLATLKLHILAKLRRHFNVVRAGLASLSVLSRTWRGRVGWRRESEILERDI